MSVQIGLGGEGVEGEEVKMETEVIMAFRGQWMHFNQADLSIEKVIVGSQSLDSAEWSDPKHMDWPAAQKGEKITIVARLKRSGKHRINVIQR
jgi:hypothetical protein